MHIPYIFVVTIPLSTLTLPTLTMGEKHHIALDIFQSFYLTSVVRARLDYWLLVFPSNGQG